MTTKKTTTTPKTKVCGRCHKRQPAANFSAYASAKDGSGLNAWDRACLAEYNAEQRAWHTALDELGLSKDQRRGVAQALRLGLTAPIAAAKSGAKSTAKAAARKAAPKASTRKVPASA